MWFDMAGPRIFRTLASELELTSATQTPRTAKPDNRSSTPGNRAICEVFSETNFRVWRAMNGIFQAGTRI